MERNIYKIGKELFITSDEEIKTGDWSFDIRGFIEKVDETYDLEVINALGKKIILTTDQDLIAEGVQAIPDEFLEWFVKNPSCERVEVESKVTKDGVWTDLKGYVELPTTHSIIHKIIIPKEEPKQEWLKNPKWGVRLAKSKKPNLDSVDFLKLVYPDSPSFRCSNWKVFDTKELAEGWIENPITLEEEHKQETLEEAINNFKKTDVYINEIKQKQERMYSEEEVLEIIRQYAFEEHLITSSKPDIWFEQFKNK